MTKMLNLAPGVSLPAEDFIESATGILAKRGKGKSGGVKVIEEGLLDTNLPFNVFDPVGIHWGLKSSFMGDKPSGYEIVVVGGKHGDLPLVRKAGREVARSIADSDANLVIDLKGSPHAAYREFVTDFCDELLDINQRPRLNIFEEAHRLLPQRVRPDQTACLDAVQRTITEGRNSALGALIVSQRPATVNKDTLTQVDNLILMGMTSPQDRKAVKEWVEQNADATDLDKFLKGLASLQTREGWLWVPDKDILQKFRFKDFKTFHPDRTHLRKLGLLKVKPAQTDVAGIVERLGSKMQAVVEEAKANDPRELKAKLKAAEAEVVRLQRAKPAAAPAKDVVEAKVEVKEVSAITPEDRKLLQEVASVLELDMRKHKHGIELAENRLAQVNEISQRVQGVLAKANGIHGHAARKLVHAVTASKNPVPLLKVSARRVGARPMPTTADSRAGQAVARVAQEGLSAPQQRILDALSLLESVRVERANRVQLALLAEASPKSSAYVNNLGVLRNKEGKYPWPVLIDYPADGEVCLTEDGRARAHAPQQAPTTEDLHRTLQGLLPLPQWRIIDALVKVYPEAMTREALAEASGASPTSSAFVNNIGALRSFRFIDYPDKGLVAAQPVLFLEA